MRYDNLGLVGDIQNKVKELEISIRSLRTTGTDLAEAEKNYKIALRKEVLKLKDEKMPATLINLTVYGIEEVAELRFKRDIAEAVYDANKEHINATKIEIKVLSEQVKREYGSDISD